MGTIYRCKGRFDREVVGRVDEDGTVYSGRVVFNMEVVGRVAEDGTVYSGKRMFTREVVGRVDAYLRQPLSPDAHGGRRLRG